MKLDWNKKYTTIAIYILIVLVLVVFSVFFFMNYGDFTSYFSAIMSAVRPLIYGAVLAYLTWPILKFFENKFFAFVTGDDKIPTVPQKPQIPKVPKEPKKPVKPAFSDDISPDKRAAKMQLYNQALAAYRREYREYKKARSEKNRAEKTCARIDKNTPRIERKIIRVTLRHERINAKAYSDGAKRTRYGARRALSTIMAEIVVLMIVGVFVYLVVPQLSEGYNEIYTKMPSYIASVTTWLNDLAARSDIIGSVASNAVESINTFLSTIYSLLQNILPALASTIKSVVITVKDLLIGIFFSIYFLLGKERIVAKFKKLFRSIFSDRTYIRLSKLGHDLNKNFGSFISAKIIDSFIVGALSFLILLILRVPYYPLISVIIMLTNIVPIFGPIVGGVIGGVIVFITNPSKLLIFIIFDIVIQQFDGNVLGPKLLGARTNTTSLGILTALTILSSFWGLTGLLIAVPLLAVVYAFIKETSEKRLAKKDLPVDTAEYYDADDQVGRALHEEAQTKKDHKTTLRQSLSNSRAGNATLNIRIVSDFVDKVDKTDELRQAEFTESEVAFEEALGKAEEKETALAAETSEPVAIPDEMDITPPENTDDNITPTGD